MWALVGFVGATYVLPMAGAVGRSGLDLARCERGVGVGVDPNVLPGACEHSGLFLIEYVIFLSTLLPFAVVGLYYGVRLWRERCGPREVPGTNGPPADA